jgi:hypothetical protein
MKVGDLFTLNVPIYRRWWQFWMPRVRHQTKTFKVISVASDA